jgi:hypothetical protein
VNLVKYVPHFLVTGREVERTLRITFMERYLQRDISDI